jgi:hypothetical protein
VISANTSINEVLRKCKRKDAINTPSIVKFLSYASGDQINYQILHECSPIGKKNLTCREIKTIIAIYELIPPRRGESEKNLSATQCQK